MKMNRTLTMTGGILVLLGLSFSAPVLAQSNGNGGGGPSYHITNLSDVTGPFLGNVNVPVPGSATTTPRVASVWVSLPDLFSQSLVQQTATGGQNTNAALVSSAITFNQSMDKLLPFCGCASPRWRNYNHTVKTAEKLRQALGNAVSEQRKILLSNPTPEQVDAAQKRLKTLEDTTLALEKAAEVLTALSNALDKAR